MVCDYGISWSYALLQTCYLLKQGHDALAVCRAHRGLPVGFLPSFSGVQFYLLFSPYLCYISLLYLDLYVLGDDAMIS